MQWIQRPRGRESQNRPARVDRGIEARLRTKCNGFVTIMAEWAGFADASKLGEVYQQYSACFLQHIRPDKGFFVVATLENVG